MINLTLHTYKMYFILVYCTEIFSMYYGLPILKTNIFVTCFENEQVSRYLSWIRASQYNLFLFVERFINFPIFFLVHHISWVPHKKIINSLFSTEIYSVFWPSKVITSYLTHSAFQQSGQVGLTLIYINIIITIIVFCGSVTITLYSNDLQG